MTDYNFKRWIVTHFTKRGQRKERRFVNLDFAIMHAKRNGVDVFDDVEKVYF